MSLKRLLDARGTPAILNQWITRPPSIPRFEIVVPAGQSPQFIGMAFDHAIRAGIRATYPTIGLGIAEAASIALAAPGQTRKDRGVQSRFETALAELANVSPDSLTISQAKACLYLAAVETVYRSGYADRLESEPSSTEIEELIRLFAIVPWAEFKPEALLVLNPSFNDGSRRVRGADADLLIDDVIVDVKTVSDCALTLPRIRQVVCYAALANRYGVTGVGPVAVRRIGVYFARAGQLTILSLDDVVTSGGLEALTKWLVQRKRPAA
jgi:hypothetical protein